ncbi:phage head-tail connector protein [Virgibacillus sp. C22-A2]|uniref:Phage head-tail connector protein n=1 Tax=Virgibacillus tibetensis TaxID=3042313 RepID=A0ABU6K9U7_9BACI|nr:phage head-tail connector protein [Virgibacillus sp. C22-A2]
MEVSDVKSILRWKTTKHDDYTTTMLPLMIEAVKDDCNNPFIDENGKESLPGGVQIAVAKWIEYNTNQAGVTGRSQGVSYSYDVNVPDSIKSFLRPYKRLRF